MLVRTGTGNSQENSTGKGGVTERRGWPSPRGLFHNLWEDSSKKVTGGQDKESTSQEGGTIFNFLLWNIPHQLSMGTFSNQLKGLFNEGRELNKNHRESERRERCQFTAFLEESGRFGLTPQRRKWEGMDWSRTKLLKESVGKRGE